MKNFKYCLWFIPDKSHPWYQYTSDFSPHMTIKSNFERKIDALLFYNSIQIKPINVKLVGNLSSTYDNGFYALVYNLEVIGEKPKYWPDNAHISFKYKYDNPFTMNEYKELNDKIKIKEGKLMRIRINHCEGHYSSWNKF